MLPFVMEALGTSFLTGLLGAAFAVIGVRRDPTWEANYSGLLLMPATLLACRYYRAILSKTDPPALLGSPLASPRCLAWYGAPSFLPVQAPASYGSCGWPWEYA